MNTSRTFVNTFFVELLAINYYIRGLPYLYTYNKSFIKTALNMLPWFDHPMENFTYAKPFFIMPWKNAKRDLHLFRIYLFGFITV